MQGRLNRDPVSGEGSADLMLGVASANTIRSNTTPEQMMLRKMRSVAD
jgi:hypothetical protein